ncbi:MAG: tripartite tricarboxylate transporter substrate binding protein [Comamonadaceae bacterium]|nr:MAG: tripartite tricarboxylate transporter substrate binding protein [Comamonadaceae bacterium]
MHSSFPRRRLLAVLALASALGSGTVRAQAPAPADAFPVPGKAVTLILPAVGGSTGDRVLRMFADRLKDDWKVPVIVEAKPGAGGEIGSAFVARAAPDGHTILLGFSHLVQAYAFNKTPPYDAMKDLVPIARICDLPMLYLTGDPSIQKMDDVVAKVKASGQGSYGSYGNATTSHIYSELVNRRNNLGMAHAAYRGTPPLITDLLAGHITTAVIDLGNTMTHIKAGKLKPLAVTGTKRNRLVPDVPTFAELGYRDVSLPGRYWLMLPAGTPAPTVERIRASVLKVLKAPEVQEQMLAMGIEPAPAEREDVAADMRADVEYWKRVVQITGITSSQ